MHESARSGRIAAVYFRQPNKRFLGFHGKGRCRKLAVDHPDRGVVIVSIIQYFWNGSRVSLGLSISRDGFN